MSFNGKSFDEKAKHYQNIAMVKLNEVLDGLRENLPEELFLKFQEQIINYGLFREFEGQERANAKIHYRIFG